MAALPLLAERAFGLGGRSSNMVIIEFVMTSIAILLVLNRLHVRLAIGTRLGSDDWFILSSMIFCIAMNAVNIAGVNHGYGRFSHTVPPADLQAALQISILLLYRKIFDTKRFRFRFCCNIVIGYVTTYAVASILATIFQCIPVAKSWDSSLPGTCISLTAAWYANAAYNISSDLIILILPMPVIQSLRLPIRQKVGLTLVFTLGIFVCATSIVRVVALDLTSKSLDANHGTMISTLWTTIEANMAIICSCLPMLRPTLSRLFPNLFPPFQYSGSGSNNNNARGNNRNNAAIADKDGAGTVSPRSSRTAINPVEGQNSPFKTVRK